MNVDTQTIVNMESPDDIALADRMNAARGQIIAELKKLIVGQDDTVNLILLSLFVGGNSLIIGVPGLAKTLLIRTLAQVLDLKFNRIQFTPDLMPSDITGTDIIQEDAETGRRAMTFSPGPIFANIVLADEINRTPPKTQAALLEAMQEHQVTASGIRHQLPEPFFVLATQNPIEMEGTYPLPEAQLDRFMFNVVIDYLPEDEEVEVVTRTTINRAVSIQPFFTAEDVLRFHQVVRKVPIAEEIVRYAVRLTAASRPKQKGSPDFVNEWVSWGAGLRAAQYMVLGAKARALIQGRSFARLEDIQALACAALRHRILIKYRAEADGVTVESLIAKLVALVDTRPTKG